MDDHYLGRLQYADMVAFLMREEITRRLETPDQPPNPMYTFVSRSSKEIPRYAPPGNILS